MPDASPTTPMADQNNSVLPGLALRARYAIKRRHIAPARLVGRIRFFAELQIPIIEAALPRSRKPSESESA